MQVYVRYIENEGAVRYCLQRADGLFWSGEEWKQSRRKALLWANIADCHKEYFRLTDDGKDRGPCRHFVARFDVFVNGHASFTVEELTEWLGHHVRFTVTTENGPVDGCRTQVYARFGTLAEKFYKPRVE